MKVIGKKDIRKQEFISKTIMIYFFLMALLIVIFINNYNDIVFIISIVTLGLLLIERIITYLVYKRLSNDLIVMHRNYVTVRTLFKTYDIKYQHIKDITIKKNKKLVFRLVDDVLISVTNCLNIGQVRDEILDYKQKIKG